MKKIGCIFFVFVFFAFSAFAQNCECLTKDTFTNLIKRASPSVVNLYVDKIDGRVMGTGFFVEDGSGNVFVITNKHVTEGSTGYVDVRMPNGKTLVAEVVKESSRADISILRISEANWDEKIEVFPMRMNAEEVFPGQWVLAIGNPLGLENSCAIGIISNTSREIKQPGFNFLHKFIQIDASINPGNSGGPLINLDGEVIGVVTAIRGMGIAVAIPIEIVIEELEILTRGVQTGWLGLNFHFPDQDMIDDLGLEENGFLISLVSGPAKEAGLEQLDMIVSFDGELVDFSASGCDRLKRKIMSLPLGEEVSIVVFRNGEKIEFKLKISEKPESEKFKIFQ